VKSNPTEAQNKQAKPTNIVQVDHGIMKYCGSFKSFILPVIIGFFTFFNMGMSKSGPIMPSRIPIWDPRPSDNNMEKKSKLQNGAPGNFVKTSAITMKARPVPCAAYRKI